ncbi:MAG: hypothetical protein K2W99_07940 [Chthoniobacterales bacterium]|nr:hypothetical protein [Chthoniobacterales bacterium]
MTTIATIKKAPSLALPLFILVAALLHLSTIYLFNIVYQAPGVSKPSAGQVFFLQSGSAAYQELEPWLKENDPAVFSPLKTIQWHRNNTPFRCYRMTHLPPLHLLPPVETTPIEPPLLPVHEAVLPPKTLFSSPHFLENSAHGSPQKKGNTTVSFLEGLAPRALVLATLAPVLSQGITTTLAPTMLRANIDDAGIPRHVIVIQSSGNSVADETATAWLMKQRLAPSTHETWGSVLILWGNNS